MTESRSLRYGTIVAALAASVAAFAASVQAHIIWTGRNDILKATFLSEAVRQCTVANNAMSVRVRAYNEVLDSWKTEGAQARYIDPKTGDDVTTALLSAAAIFAMLDPAAVQDFYSKANAFPHFTNLEVPNKSTSIPALITFIKDSERYQVDLVSACHHAAKTIAFN